MERPFDHAGMSETTGFDPHQLTIPNGRGINHSFDDFGGVTVNYTLCFAPSWWTKRQIAEAVSMRFEAEYCRHDYDCCGRYYGGAGHVVDVTAGKDDNGDDAKLVVVRTTYTQNV